MIKSYKYRLYPNKTQEINLSKHFGCARFVWNKWVENFNQPDKTSKDKTSKELKDEYLFLNEVSAGMLQQRHRDWIEFKKQFFNKNRKSKIRPPRYKSKRNKQSYRLPYPKFDVRGNKLKIERVGFVSYSANQIIPCDSRIISATISVDVCGNYWVSIQVEQEVKKLPKTGISVGIDMGLSNLSVLSDGTIFENKKIFIKNQNKLKTSQKHLSRKLKGSNHYKRQKLKITKLYRHISNQRNLYLHTISYRIIKDYDIICVEDLNIEGMKKRFGKGISDAGISILISFMQYKAEWYGKEIRKINRFYPSTKTCSSCGHKQNIKLCDRMFKCESCGMIKDRDLNAALNIKSVGMQTDKHAWTEYKTDDVPSLANLNETLIK